MKMSVWLGLGWLAMTSLQAKPLDGVVLVIADGTSQELITAARNYAQGAQGRLHLEAFPRTAIVRTFSASDLVTDSGAAATALARGIKADNRVVGMADPLAKTAPPSILDLAKKAGWSTAVVTDDAVMGATPAAFLVEHGNRNESVPIAAKLLDQLGPRVDLVLGGGSKWFMDQSPKLTYKEGELEEVRKNEAKLRSLPVKTFMNWEEFVADPNASQVPMLGVFAPESFAFYADGKRALRLKDMVAQAVKKLRERQRPFLLVVEAGLPDKACHLNQAKRAIIEVLEFDETLGWLQENLGPNVLMLATTDHQTGGFTFNGPPAPLSLKGDSLLRTNPGTQMSYFTWASGPGSDRSGTRELTDPEFTQPALLPRPSAYHTAGDVWLLADGPGSETVGGFLDNTDIYKILARAIQASVP